MFDSPTPQPQNQGQQNITPPPNLPVDRLASRAPEPEDILASVDATEAKPTSRSVAAPITNQPITRSSQSIGGVPLRAAAAPEPLTERREPFFKRYQQVIVLILLLLVGGTALGFGGWYAYAAFFANRAAKPAINQNANASNNSTNQTTTNQNTNATVPNGNQNAAANANVNQPPLDTDHDGVSDQEEALYGTDPTKVDTDNDGLTDRDEVKVFKTDPNKADTDGDGFSDGVEVRGGYDPKGPGKLLQIQ